MQGVSCGHTDDYTVNYLMLYLSNLRVFSDIIPFYNYNIFNYEVFVLVRMPVYVSFTVYPKLVLIPVAARSKASV